LLQEKFHVTFKKVIEYIPRCYDNAMILSLLVILPSEGTTIVHANGWDFFANKIPNYMVQSIETKEIIVIIPGLIF
jgi:hypothetical protein